MKDVFKPHLKKPLDVGRLSPNSTIESENCSFNGRGYYEFMDAVYGELPHNKHTQFIHSDNEKRWEARKKHAIPVRRIGEEIYLTQQEVDYYSEYPIMYSVNSMNFRGPGIFEEGKKHILFLGDSHVSGIGLHYKHTAAGYLSDYYTKQGYNFVTLGVHGSGRETCYRLLAYYAHFYDIEKVFVLSPHPYRYEFREPLIRLNVARRGYYCDDTNNRNFSTRGLGNIDTYGMNDFWQRVISDDVNTYIKDIRALDAMYGICSVKKANIVNLNFPWPNADRTYISPIDDTIDWLGARDLHWSHANHFYLANKFIHYDKNEDYYNPMNKPKFEDMYSPDNIEDERMQSYVFEDKQKRHWKGRDPRHVYPSGSNYLKE